MPSHHTRGAHTMLWAAASQWEVRVENMETGAVFWRPEPETTRHLYAGRYRTKPEAHSRLCRVLAERFSGFDIPTRRSTMLRGRNWPHSYGIRTAENASGTRDGYAFYPSASRSRERFYVVKVEGTRPYDVPVVYVPCSYCNARGEMVRYWREETEPRKCEYCNGRGTLIDMGDKHRVPTPDDQGLFRGPVASVAKGTPVRGALPSA